MSRDRYQPRKKKIHGPVVIGMKYVVVDHKTTIMVKANISDDDARERYLERINRPIRGPWNKVETSTPNMPLQPEFKENEVSVEELEGMLEEVKAELPDDE